MWFWSWLMVVVAMWGITAVLAKASILNVTMMEWAVGLNPCLHLQGVCIVPVCFTHGNSLQTKWLRQCYFEGGCWDVTSQVCMTWCKREGNAFSRRMYKAWNMKSDCWNLFRWGNLILLFLQSHSLGENCASVLSFNWANTFILWALYTHIRSCCFGFFWKNNLIKTNSSFI